MDRDLNSMKRVSHVSRLPPLRVATRCAVTLSRRAGCGLRLRGPRSPQRASIIAEKRQGRLGHRSIPRDKSRYGRKVVHRVAKIDMGGKRGKRAAVPVFRGRPTGLGVPVPRNPGILVDIETGTAAIQWRLGMNKLSNQIFASNYVRIYVPVEFHRGPARHLARRSRP